jgi:hypothetical protein
MKGKRFTEEQIIGVLKEAEGGAKVIDVWKNPWGQVLQSYIYKTINS